MKLKQSQSVLMDMVVDTREAVLKSFVDWKDYNFVAFNAVSLAKFLPENVERSKLATDPALLVKASQGASALMFWLYEAMHRNMITRQQVDLLADKLVQVYRILNCMIKYRTLRESLTVRKE